MKTLSVSCFLLLASSAFANNTCQLNVNTAAHYSFSTTVASDWTSCGSTTPQPGDNLSIIGTAHTFVLDTPYTFGNGQAPYKAYPATITGSAGGSTACAGSMPALGGSSYNLAGGIACSSASGACVPYIYSRGFYSATGTTNIAAACTGGSPSYTLNWNPGGGTPAILSGSSTLVRIAAAVTARGDVLAVDSYGDTSLGIQFGSGGNLTFDFSLSSATTVMYNLGNQGNNGVWSRAYKTDGTCTIATCSVVTAGGGAWRLANGGGTGIGPIFSFTGIHLSHAGDASEPWFWMSDNYNPYGAFTLTNAQLDHSSLANIQGTDNPGSTIVVQNVQWTNSVVSNLSLQSGLPAASLSVGGSNTWDGTGTRIISGCASDIGLVNGTMPGFTFTGNVASNMYVIGVNGRAMTFSNNLIMSSVGNGNSFTTPGNMNYNLVYFFGAPTNWHVWQDSAETFNLVESYNIFGVSNPNTGDSGEITRTSSSTSYTTAFTNNIMLPDPAGHAFAEPGGSEELPGPLSLDHNYWYADYGQSNPAFGFLQLDEGIPALSGIVTSMRCNTFWNPAHTNSFVKVDDQGATPTVQNVGAGSAFDYNWGRGGAATQASACTGCTNQRDGYVSYFSAGQTPGAHDIDAIDPGIDYQRTIETFAAAYLAFTPSRGVWSSATDYAQGDTVSSAVAGFYWGKTLPYTCTLAAGCAHTSAPQPGTGAWYLYWEPFTLTWLKTNVAAATRLVDGALQVLGMSEDAACTPAAPCDPITAVRHWIYAGHIPSNRQFWGACPIDGKAIGPIDGAANARPNLPLMTN